jgi:hypothetical protein
MCLNGEQLGFIPTHVSRGGDSSGLAYRMDRGEKYECRISDLTGGGRKTLGVNIEIKEADEEADVAESATMSNMPPIANLEPAGGNYVWLWLVGALAAIVILLVVILR